MPTILADIAQAQFESKLGLQPEVMRMNPQIAGEV